MRSATLGSLLALIVATACAPAAPSQTQTGSANANSTTAAPTVVSSAAGTPAGQQRSANQVLRVAKTSLPPAITPEASLVNNDIFNPVYDSLLTFDANHEVHAGVASKWEIVDNNWRFTIRQDLTFSDGVKLTADDVVFSANLIVEKNLPTKSFLPLLTGAKKIDDKTVELTTKQVDATIPSGAPWIYVLPQAYYEKAGKEQFGQKPIGSGPYQVTKFELASEAVMKLRSTPHPYRKPTLTEIHYVVVPEISQQVVGLRTGELDFALSAFSADQLNQLKNEKFNIVSRVSGGTTALFSQPEAQARNSPLMDKRVRQALNYAINKQAIIDAFFKGYARPASQLPLEGTMPYNDSLKPYPYNPAKAKQLLAEAGYPNGVKLPSGLGFTPATVPPDLVQIIQDNLRAVGVEAEINQYEYAVFLDQYYGRNNAQKDDLFFQSGGDPTGTFSLIRGQYSCDKQGFATWFCVPGFVKLYDESTMETNNQKRKQLLQQAVATLMDEVPVLLLYQKDATAVMKNDLRGFTWPMPTWYDYDTLYRAG